MEREKVAAVFEPFHQRLSFLFLIELLQIPQSVKKARRGTVCWWRVGICEKSKGGVWGLESADVTTVTSETFARFSGVEIIAL